MQAFLWSGFASVTSTRSESAETQSCLSFKPAALRSAVQFEFTNVNPVFHGSNRHRNSTLPANPFPQPGSRHASSAWLRRIADPPGQPAILDAYYARSHKQGKSVRSDMPCFLSRQQMTMNYVRSKGVACAQQFAARDSGSRPVPPIQNVPVGREKLTQRSAPKVARPAVHMTRRQSGHKVERQSFRAPRAEAK